MDWTLKGYESGMMSPEFPHGKLTKLKELNLTVTFVSPEAARQLQSALPGCKVQW